MGCVDKEKSTNIEHERTMKFYNYKGGLTKGHAIIESLQKENEALMAMLYEAETKAKEWTIKEQTLQESSDQALSTQ